MSAGAAPQLLAALRERLAGVEPARIDRIWLFPARPVGEAESSLAVIALFDPTVADRREVLTLHCAAVIRNGRVSREDRLVDQGTVPADRVELLIRGMLQRLRDEAEVPRSEVIAGSASAWARLLGADAAAA